MNISVKLLNQYLEKPLTTEVMADTLEKTEIEVEEILYAKKLDEKIIIAKVKDVKMHPNADRLKLAIVMTDAGEINIVCGAPNIKTGMTVALAQVGTTLPNGEVIVEAEIRGEKSHGMLCSAYELGWSDDHSGLVELDPALPIGKSLCDIEENTDIIDIKTPSNRWDYLSYIGIAREISSILPDNKLIEPEVAKNTYKNREVVKVNSELSCKGFVYVKLSVQNNFESPKWLVDNLQASGMRSVNPVVDITNFVMLETGQPSHAYDYKKVQGKLGVRYANTGESFTTLDNKRLPLTVKDLVVVDKSGPIALAGVVGGLATETSDETKEIILEIANFDKTVVRRSALRHGLRTEASSRFERGLPISLPSLAADRIIDLLKKVCSAKVIDEPIYQAYEEYNQKFNGMRLRKAEKFLGYKIDEKEAISILEKKGFKPGHFSLTKEVRSLPAKLSSDKNSAFVENFYSKAGIQIGKTTEEILSNGMEVPTEATKPADVVIITRPDDTENVAMISGANKVVYYRDGKRSDSSLSKIIKESKSVKIRRYAEKFNHIISLEIPWWRLDVVDEVDIFEELAKSIGYDNMPATLPNLEPTSTVKHLLLPYLLELKKSLAAYGVNEVVTHSFVSEKDIATSLSDLSKNLQIENPLSREQDYMRSNLIASHLRAVTKNLSARHNAIFEISRIYERDGKSIEEKWHLGLTVWGKDSLLRLKGVLDVLFEIYRIEVNTQRDLNSKLYYSGRAAKIGSGFGHFGQINEKILRNFQIDKEVSFAELDIQVIIESQRSIEVKEPVPYQMVSRDLTVQLDNMVTYEEIKNNLEGIAESVYYIGEYSDQDLSEKSEKRISISLELNMGPNPKSEEIEATLQKCRNKLEKLPKAKVL